MPATLYLVSTPIGNLSDISARALSTLREADFIACEDTRITRKLLSHYDIKKPVMSYHSYNDKQSGAAILERLLTGESCALVSDAGTPGISDPGEHLVKLCADAGVDVIAIPGPCAAITSLSISGQDTKRFVFEGFLPTTIKKRKSILSSLKDEKRTMVFYEAPHRLIRTLTEMLTFFGDRQVSISRELTKIYEETLRMSLSEAIDHFCKNAPRGEFTIVARGCGDTVQTEDALSDAIVIAKKYIESGETAKDAIKFAVTETGCSKNALYEAIIAK